MILGVLDREGEDGKAVPGTRIVVIGITPDTLEHLMRHGCYTVKEPKLRENGIESVVTLLAESEGEITRMVGQLARGDVPRKDRPFTRAETVKGAGAVLVPTAQQLMKLLPSGAFLFQVLVLPPGQTFPDHDVRTMITIGCASGAQADPAVSEERVQAAIGALQRALEGDLPGRMKAAAEAARPGPRGEPGVFRAPEGDSSC